VGVEVYSAWQIYRHLLPWKDGIEEVPRYLGMRVKGIFQTYEGPWLLIEVPVEGPKGDMLPARASKVNGGEFVKIYIFSETSETPTPLTLPEGADRYIASLSGPTRVTDTACYVPLFHFYEGK
jgi:hypothetical protein